MVLSAVLGLIGHKKVRKGYCWREFGLSVRGSRNDDGGMSLLIFALLLLIVLAVVIYIVRLLGFGQPWTNIIIAVLCLIGLLVLVGKLGYLPMG